MRLGIHARNAILRVYDGEAPGKCTLHFMDWETGVNVSVPLVDCDKWKPHAGQRYVVEIESIKGSEYEPDPEVLRMEDDGAPCP